MIHNKSVISRKKQPLFIAKNRYHRNNSVFIVRMFTISDYQSAR